MKPKGFVCPNCDKKLVTLDTRRRASGVVVRRRACPTCPYRLTTDERPRPTTRSRHDG